MGRRHSRELLLEVAFSLAAREGLHRLSFGRVAAAAGVSDRMVVYYFATKKALLAAVIEHAGAVLESALLSTSAAAQVVGPAELAGRAWKRLAEGDGDTDLADRADAVAVLMQTLGLAACRAEPFAGAARAAADSWVAWLAAQVVGDDDHRRSVARGALAVLDGLLVLRVASGEGAAEDAARALVGTGRGPETGPGTPDR